MSRVRRQQDGRLYLVLPKDLSDEVAALAAFKGQTLVEVVREFVTIGLLVSKQDDIVLCRVDSAGIHTEVDLDGEEE